MRILLVDDEDAILQIASGVLEQAGHTVTTSHNNEDALRLYQNGAYELVLTDAEHLAPVWQNPDGGEGLILAEAIRKRNPQQPIGFVTAHHHPIETYPSLPKPFTRDELLRFITEVVQGKALPSSSGEN